MTTNEAQPFEETPAGVCDEAFDVAGNQALRQEHGSFERPGSCLVALTGDLNLTEPSIY